MSNIINLFPEKRAIIINGHNSNNSNYDVFSASKSIPEYNPLRFPISQMYSMAFFLTGKLGLNIDSETDEKLTLDQILTSSEITSLGDSNADPSEFLLTHYPEITNRIPGGNLGYTEVVRLHGRSNNPQGLINNLDRKIREFRDKQKSNDLTLIILYSNGDNNQFEMGEEHMKYREFFHRLQRIQGKKAVLFLGSNSGYMILAAKTYGISDINIVTGCESYETMSPLLVTAVGHSLMSHFSSHKSTFYNVPKHKITIGHYTIHPQTYTSFKGSL